MQIKNRIASSHQIERRGGGGFPATARRRLLPLLLVLFAVLAQGCAAVKEVTREVVLPLAANPEYKPLLASAEPASVAASAAVPADARALRPAADPAPAAPAEETATPTPTPEPAPKPGEAARPGNPASWGESGSQAAGRRFDPIYFNGQGTELDAVARQRLASYATWLRDHPQVWLTLVGHADRHAGYGYAYNLGMTRALAVADYLVGAGLDPRRIFTTSLGKDQPASEEKNPEADALNNRVEILGFVPPPGVDSPPEAGLNQDAAPEPETAPQTPEGRDLPRQ